MNCMVPRLVALECIQLVKAGESSERLENARHHQYTRRYRQTVRPGRNAASFADQRHGGVGRDLRHPRPRGSWPPPHVHPWEEVYVVLSGELEVTVDGQSSTLGAGGVAHVPANVKHAYRNLTEAHFLTIVTKGNAAKFFAEVAAKVEMNPPDIPGVIRVAKSHDIEFLL